MSAYELASTIVAALGLVGGAIGFFRSRVAGRAASAAAAKAADAQADAAVALQKSAAADQRIAAALEAIAAHRGPTSKADSADGHPNGDLAAELRALVPPAAVHWRIESRLEANTVRLRNTGTIDAMDVAVQGSAVGGARLIESGGAIVLNISAADGALIVTWRDVTAPDPHSAELSPAADAPRPAASHGPA